MNEIVQWSIFIVVADVIEIVLRAVSFAFQWNWQVMHICYAPGVIV